jgi:hypothetical protein
MNKNLVLDVFNGYIMKTDDLYAKKFFDTQSEKNLEYKYKVITWALLNNKLITQYEEIDEELVFELYPKENIRWDL